MKLHELRNQDLGTVEVTTSTGHWHNQPGRSVFLKLRLICRNHGSENDLGEIDSLYPHVRGYFDDKNWQEDVDGLIYTDQAVEDQVNKFLQDSMFPGRVNYSEMGMQEGYVDFDADAILVAYFYPELINLIQTID